MNLISKRWPCISMYYYVALLSSFPDISTLSFPLCSMTSLPALMDQDVVVHIPRAIQGTVISYLAVWSRSINVRLCLVTVKFESQYFWQQWELLVTKIMPPKYVLVRFSPIMCNLLEPVTEEQKSNKSIGSPHNVTVSENTWHVRCQCWLRNVGGGM